MILVTGATGMFGSRVVKALLARGERPRAMSRSESGASTLADLGAEPVLADMEDPASLERAMEKVSRVFLVSPMHPNLAQRELNVVEAARRSGVDHVVKLYGSVRHGEDELNRMHQEAITALKQSGLHWTLVSPNTIMETNLFPHAPSIKQDGAIYASAGQGRMGMVSADDTAEAAGVVLTTPGHHEQNYELTGPESVTYADVAEAFTRVLGRPVRYEDLPEEELGQILVSLGYTPEQAELEVLCHFRIFREGAADLVTDTFERLTGRKPTSVEDFIRRHKQVFE